MLGVKERLRAEAEPPWASPAAGAMLGDRYAAVCKDFWIVGIHAVDGRRSAGLACEVQLLRSAARHAGLAVAPTGHGKCMGAATLRSGGPSAGMPHAD